MTALTFVRRWWLPLGAVGVSLGAALGMMPPPALAQELCLTDDVPEPPAETLRTVDLPDFNLAVEIPSNYRVMKRQDGSVEILHPDDFEMFQCLLRGGYGGQGYYSEVIQLVDPDPTLSLREQAIWSVGYQLDSSGDRLPAYAQLLPYEGAGGLNGYVVESISGYGVRFLGTYDGSDRLLEVTARCDCDVPIEAATDLLERITVLNGPFLGER